MRDRKALRSLRTCFNRSDPDKPEDGPRKGAVVKHSSDTSLRDVPNFHLESGPLRGTLSPFQVPEDFQNSDLDQNRRERRPREEIETRRPAHQDHPCARAVGQVHRAEGGRPQAAVRRHLNQVHHAKAVGQEHRAAEGRLRDRQGKEPGQRSKEQEEPAGSTVRSVIFVYKGWISCTAA